ncbi:unnamed protein product [Polarella glacialis]|uniref:Uncharacterized protein n=1 Tax=Polarella glacialis TaxID=89957 RepID=A0A813DCR5_POLGL|nr:unnamed protein product [Polarella glacialis]
MGCVDNLRRSSPVWAGDFLPAHDFVSAAFCARCEFSLLRWPLFLWCSSFVCGILVRFGLRPLAFLVPAGFIRPICHQLLAANNNNSMFHSCLTPVGPANRDFKYVYREVM